MACRARLPRRDGRRPRRRHTTKSHPVPFPVGEDKTGSWADQTADASWAWCRQESAGLGFWGGHAGRGRGGLVIARLVVDLGVGGVALDCLHPFEGAAFSGSSHRSVGVLRSDVTARRCPSTVPAL